MIKILLVDDEPDILEVATIALELSEEFEVEGCTSGTEALSKAQAFEPDVLLLDYMMPDMSGPQVFVKLRELPSLANVPVIFLTARADQASRETLFELGASDVITKPFDPILLSTQVKTSLQQ